MALHLSALVPLARRLGRGGLGLALAASLAPAVSAAGERPTVVELFTSQSCSSCPPADALLSELQRARTDLLVLDLHVTYWDRLGWKDPYSLEAATRRQFRYAAMLGGRQVYTPQMVIDGSREAVGSDRGAVLAAIAAAQADPQAAVAVSLAASPAGLAVRTGAGSGAASLVLVGYDAAHSTAVQGGENGGRRLAEVNVVRSLREIGAWRGLPLDLEVAPPPGEHAAVLLQREDGRILGAAVLVGR